MPLSVEELNNRIKKSFELLHVFFLAIAISFLSFWLAITSPHSTLAPYIVIIVAIFIWLLFQIHPLPFLTELLIAPLHNILLDKRQNDLESLMYAGLIMGFFGFISFLCFFGVIHLKKKVAPGVTDIGCLSARWQLLFLQVIIVFIANGYMMLAEWYTLQNEGNLYIVGWLLIYFANFLWIFFLILLCVHKCLVCRQNAVRVQAATPAGEAP